MKLGKLLPMAGSAALLTAVQVAAQQPIEIIPTGPYVHKGTGFIFPTASGPFKRLRII